MSWNYRVVKFVGKTDVSYSIHEVHYAEDGAPAMYTERPVSPSGESASGDARMDFIHSYTLWSRALEKPVLIVDTATEKFTGAEEPPMQSPPLCPNCRRPMTLVCRECEEWE